MGYGTRPALLLVDLCKAYSTSGSTDIRDYEKGAAAPRSMKRLLAAAREANVPVFWTQTKYIHLKIRDAGLYATKVPTINALQEGSPRRLNEFLDGLEPEFE